jgi:hypothetical protein
MDRPSPRDQIWSHQQSEFVCRQHHAVHYRETLGLPGVDMDRRLWEAMRMHWQISPARSS